MVLVELILLNFWWLPVTNRKCWRSKDWRMLSTTWMLIIQGTSRLRRSRHSWMERNKRVMK